jgi:hypothetical protein
MCEQMHFRSRVYRRSADQSLGANKNRGLISLFICYARRTITLAAVDRTHHAAVELLADLVAAATHVIDNLVFVLIAACRCAAEASNTAEDVQLKKKQNVKWRWKN